jgi:hypothetical protein
MAGPTQDDCGPAEAAGIDMGDPAQARQNLSTVLQAYFTLLSGGKTQEIRFGERWHRFDKGSDKALKNFYMALYAVAPDSARAGMPSLADGDRVRRGRPMAPLFVFPRL